VQIACQRLVGAYAIAVIDHRQPGKVVVAREGSPLLLGVSDTGNYAASDASALLQVTRNMVYLENGDIAELTPTNVRITRLDGTPVERPVHVSQLSAAAVELGSTATTCRRKSSSSRALANTLEIVGGSKSHPARHFRRGSRQFAGRCRLVLIIACGTSSHAGWSPPATGSKPLPACPARRDRQRIPLPHLGANPRS
jgi:glutamine---fructose-6-phosphate transaminase (isomerizing)